MAAASVVAMLAVALAPGSGARADHLPPGGSFRDDDGSPFEGWIEAVAAEGITAGCAPQRYCPAQPVTRGQVAALVAAAAGVDGPAPDAFVDDDGSPYERAVDVLAAAGVVDGCTLGDGPRSYCPTRPVTRGQAATVLVRAFDLAPAGGTDAFADDDGTLHERDVDRLAASGVTGGCSPTRFCPDRTVTRGQLAALLGRLLGLSPHEPSARRDAPGNPGGGAAVPAAADRVDTRDPDTVVGDGTADSCTGGAVVAAVAGGGTITFDCGGAPVTIPMDRPARVFNDASDQVVLDGGGLVTLDGRDRTRLLEMDTCDPSLVWTTPDCDDQDHPVLVVQGMGFTRGRATGTDLDGGGGAIRARGGQLRIVDSRFTANRCAASGPDVGGGAVRAFDQFQDRPVAVTRSTFGGDALADGNRCSNGGALSSIGVSWDLRNSVLRHNRATGQGANPARPGTPGGGNGGAVAVDGTTHRLRVLGSVLTDNVAPEGGGAVFFVSNDRTGTMLVDGSVLRRNPSLGFETLPGIFFLGARPPTVTDSVVE